MKNPNREADKQIIAVTRAVEICNEFATDVVVDLSGDHYDHWMNNDEFVDVLMRQHGDEIEREYSEYLYLMSYEDELHFE